MRHICFAWRRPDAHKLCVLYPAASILFSALLLPLAGCETGTDNSSGRTDEPVVLDLHAFTAQFEALAGETQQHGGNVELRVSFANTPLTNEQLAASPLPKDVRALDLSATKITDDGMIHLSHMKRLRTLDLTDVEITDAGLKLLYNLPELEFVELHNTKISPQAQLAFLKHLRQQTYERKQSE